MRQLNDSALPRPSVGPLGEGDLEDLAPLPKLRHFAREFVVIGKIGQFFHRAERTSECE